MQKLFFFLSFILLLVSCGSDDDICLSGESTPRLTVSFQDVTENKFIALDSLYIDVDYGNGTPRNILTQAKVTSATIPLRIDNNPYTDVYFHTTKAGNKSKIRVSYDLKPIYVSPACGFKQNYENLKAELLQSNPVLNIQPNHTSLTDESKVNFYLRF